MSAIPYMCALTMAVTMGHLADHIMAKGYLSTKNTRKLFQSFGKFVTIHKKCAFGVGVRWQMIYERICKVYEIFWLFAFWLLNCFSCRVSIKKQLWWNMPLSFKAWAYLQSCSITSDLQRCSIRFDHNSHLCGCLLPMGVGELCFASNLNNPLPNEFEPWTCFHNSSIRFKSGQLTNKKHDESFLSRIFDFNKQNLSYLIFRLIWSSAIIRYDKQKLLVKTKIFIKNWIYELMNLFKVELL